MMHEYNAELVRVIDGDTVVLDIDLGFGIWLRGEHVRLYGINAPEIRTKDEREKRRGKLAKSHLETLLAWAPITLKSEKFQRGKFGRILATLYVGDVDINAMMVEDGHAEVYE